MSTSAIYEPQANGRVTSRRLFRMAAYVPGVARFEDDTTLSAIRAFRLQKASTRGQSSPAAGLQIPA